MATITAVTSAGGVYNFASAGFTTDGTTITVNLGFQPRWIRIINVTDVVIWEKMDTLAAANSVKVVTAGTTTIDTTSAILINSDKSTITLSATAFPTGKTISLIAQC